MFVFIILVLLLFIHLSHLLSYRIIKNRILNERDWGLNICCGRTDGGGINLDIQKHGTIKNLVLADVARLPFKDGAFESVISSHTIEHVDDPQSFYNELKRVGQEVTLVVPPLWDISAALNIFEHKILYLTLRKRHRELPRFCRLPLSNLVQNRLGQKIKG